MPRRMRRVMGSVHSARARRARLHLMAVPYPCTRSRAQDQKLRSVMVYLSRLIVYMRPTRADARETGRDKDKQQVTHGHRKTSSSASGLGRRKINPAKPCHRPVNRNTLDLKLIKNFTAAVEASHEHQRNYRPAGAHKYTRIRNRKLEQLSHGQFRIPDLPGWQQPSPQATAVNSNSPVEQLQVGCPGTGVDRAGAQPTLPSRDHWRIGHAQRSIRLVCHPAKPAKPGDH